MKLKSLKKLIRISKIKENDLSTRLRSIAKQLDGLESSIHRWREHLERVEIEIMEKLQRGIDGKNLQHLLRQKETLALMLSSLMAEMGELHSEFGSLAGELMQEKNRTNLIDEKKVKIERQIQRDIGRKLELEIIETWQKT